MITDLPPVQETSPLLQHLTFKVSFYLFKKHILCERVVNVSARTAFLPALLTFLDLGICEFCFKISQVGTKLHFKFIFIKMLEHLHCWPSPSPEKSLFSPVWPWLYPGFGASHNPGLTTWPRLRPMKSEPLEVAPSHGYCQRWFGWFLTWSPGERAIGEAGRPVTEFWFLIYVLGDLGQVILVWMRFCFSTGVVMLIKGLWDPGRRVQQYYGAHEVWNQFTHAYGLKLFSITLHMRCASRLVEILKLTV